MTKSKKELTTELSAEEILNQLPGHVYWKDRDGRMIGCNENNWKDFGVKKAADYIGHTDYEVLPKEQADLLAKVDREVMRTGKPLIAEEPSDLTDGSTATFLSHKKPLKDRRGKTIGIIGTSLNVTQEWETNAKKIHLLEKIITLMPGHIYWRDTKGNYLGCNNEQARSLGLTRPHDITKKRPYSSLPKKEAQELLKNDQRIVEDGISVTLEEAGIRENGNFGTFLTKKTPLYDAEGEVTGLLGISFDITDRKKAEKELQAAKEAAEAANTAKMQFIQNMEHDLRTPSSGVAQMIQMLEEQEMDSEKKETLGQVRRSAKQLLDLINSILDFDQITNRNAPIIEKKFDLREIVNDVIDVELPAAHSKNLELPFKCADNVPQIVLGDSMRLYRVLLNVVGNAIKFTDKGFVRVGVQLIKKIRNKKVLLQFTVQDTGIGIPEDKINTIYERFTRCTPANEGRFPGSGLGLSIAKQMVDDLGGEIEVKSKLGEGTTFNILIPFKLSLIDIYDNIDEQEAPETAPPITNPLPGKNINVLLVEDDMLAQKIGAAILTNNCGAKTEVVATGKEALDAIKKQAFDIVFLDLGLPDTTGYQVAKEIRKLGFNNLPIIALTAHNAKTAKAETKKYGMNDFFTKPLNREKASKLLAKWCPVKAPTAVTPKKKSHKEKIGKSTIKKSIDMPLGLELANGDKKLATKLLDILIQRLPDDQKNIEEFFAKQDLKKLRHTVHKLSGSASYCGTLLLCNAAKSYENALLDNKVKSLPRLQKRILKEIAAVLKAYAKLA